MVLTGQNYIAGERKHNGQATFSSVNPRTKSPNETKFYNATADEINEAVYQASEAFKITRNYSASKLANFLDTVAQEIENIGDELIETADQETGLGIGRFQGERGRTTGQLRKFATLLREGSYVEAIIDPAMPDRQPLPRSDIRRMLFPIGPVAVFGASNFPLAFSVAGGDTASAFAAGCPVVVKAHPSHPATSELVAQAIQTAIEKSDFPPGFFSMVQGNTNEVGQLLVQHPSIEGVGFTGSLRGGRALFDLASQREKPIPVYAEMGSINPVVILPSAVQARSEALADGLTNSVTLGTGQFCTNPGVILMLDSAETQQLIQMVVERMNQQSAGVLLNAGIEKGLINAVQHTAKHPNVTILTNPQSPDHDGYCHSNTVLQTTAVAFRHESALREEHFGPVTMFVLCDSLEDMQKTIDCLEGNLTGTVHAENDDLESARMIFDALREKVGRLIFNGYPTGVEVGYSMQHGGPYPATTAPGTTSVGMTAIKRWMRPVAFQDIPNTLLPDALKDENPLGIWRLVDGETTQKAID